MKEYKEAIEQVKQARQNLSEAEPQYVEAAIYALNAAELRLNNIFQEIKNGPEVAATTK